MELKIDDSRRDLHGSTEIYVRAQNAKGRYENADIAELNKESLQEWLRSRGGDNPWAENCVALLLGHSAFEWKPRPDTPDGEKRSAYMMVMMKQGQEIIEHIEKLKAALEVGLENSEELLARYERELGDGPYGTRKTKPIRDGIKQIRAALGKE